MAFEAVLALAWAAWAVTWAMAAFVLWVDPHRAANRRLAIVFFLHGVAIANWVLVPLVPTVRFALGVNMQNYWALLALPFVSLWFLATLDTPLARLWRRPAALAIMAAAFLALIAPFYLWRERFLPGVAPWVLGGYSFQLSSASLVLFELTAPIYLLAFLTALQAWARAPRGTPQRDQAFWFLLAFGIHDLYFFYRLAVLAFAYQGASPLGAGWISPTILYGRPISLIVWVTLLAYGMLRHQVLGLDLKLKAGLGRTIVVALIAATFFLVSELAEGLLPVDGLIPGLVGAALVTLAIVPLQKAVHRVMDRLMPSVQDTPDYRQRRGQEIYAMALASVRADGVVDADDEAMLARLRLRLGLDEPAARPPATRRAGRAGRTRG